MTDREARQREEKFGHPVKYWAYYDGRNSVLYNTRCEFETPYLREEWETGRKHMLSEIRLNADEEWDNE